MSLHNISFYAIAKSASNVRLNWFLRDIERDLSSNTPLYGPQCLSRMLTRKLFDYT